MMRGHLLPLAGAFSSLLSTALSLPQPSPQSCQAVELLSIPSLTAALLTIAPASSTCASAPIPSECATASQAAPHILDSFATYHVSCSAARGALIALMAYETGEFKYDRNHFPPPGVAGQGTRNLQSPAFNLLYAQSLPAAWAQITAEGLQGNASGILDVLTGNGDWDWGSAAWFFRTQCPADVQAGLGTGTLVGWENYLSVCVGVANDAGRQSYWTAAMSVLGELGA